MQNKRCPLLFTEVYKSTGNAQITDVSDVNKSKIVR